MSWRTKTRFRATFRILSRAHKNNCWKHPDKKDYFFGVHDDNRLQFTVGRDIWLDPPQRGDPFNYFIYPYSELDEKPFAVESTRLSQQWRLSPFLAAETAANRLRASVASTLETAAFIETWL